MMLMALYQTQKRELVRAFSSLVSTRDGKVAMGYRQITPVESRALGYCMQYIDTSVKSVK